jgi:hypothetical protein
MELTNNKSEPTTTAATSEQARVDAAHRANKELGALQLACSQRLGDLTARLAAKLGELKRISPAVGPRGLIVDPADRDPKIPARRVAIEEEVADLENNIKSEEVISGDLRQQALVLKAEADAAEYGTDVLQTHDYTKTLVQTAITLRDLGLRPLAVWIDRMQIKYPKHEGTFKAHGGAPPFVGRLINLDRQIEALLEAIAEVYDRELLDPSEPARQRAEAILRSEQHRSDAVVAAQKRVNPARVPEPHNPLNVYTPPPSPPLDIWSVVAENDKAVAAREAAK